MATTESNYTVSNSSTTNYSFTFPYLKTTDVKLSINGVASSAFTFANATTIQLNSNPTVGDKLRIYRETDDSKLEATFFAGSAIKSSDLNDNFTQNLYVTQESNNKIDAAWTTGDETIDSTESWHTSDDTRVATTKAIENRVDAKIDTALTTDVAAGNKITVTDNSPGSGQITIGVTTASLVNSDINASAAIAGTKVDPNFGSQNIVTSGTAATGASSVTGNITVSGTVDGRDVAADGSKLDGIETGATADQTNAEIRAAVEAATDSNVFTDADHSKLNAIEASATADQTDAEIRTAVESATDSNVFTDADHSKLNAIEPNATADQTASEIKTLIASSPLDDSHLAANSVGDSEIVTGALDNRYYTKTTSDARYFNISTGDTIKDGDTFPDNDTTIATTAAINDRIIDLVDDVGGFVPIANETSFPNANPDVNNGAGTLVSIKTLASNLTSNGSGVATVANGTVGNSTVTITGLDNSTTYNSGFGMIVETTTTLNTYTFHRLVPKATEVSTVAGNIANINTVGNNNTNINTVAGANSNITTVATNISNVNNVGGSIANVNTVATNISNVNDFSDKYRVASSAPSSNNDAGDLYFDTSSNELRVYNGSAWQGGVTATGNLASLGANTFTGAQTFVSSQTFDGRDVSADGAKLDGIETGATADQTNAEIRAAVEAASDSNVFTDADHTKLNAIEANATADQSNAEIRAAVEAASDSHVFTDADHTKLNSVESGATADQTKSEIEALNINADTVDGIHGASFVRSDASDNLSGTYNFNGTSSSEKIILSGSNDPFIRWQEGTTNKAYIQWSPAGYLQFGNQEDGSVLLFRDNLSFSQDGSNFHTVWHAGNDGSGSGLDADTLDGVHGASFLRSDADDSYSGNLTMNGLVFKNNSNNNRNLRIHAGGTGDAGITMYDSSSNWILQLYGTTSGNYGFLNANWSSWDIKKAVNGQMELRVGGTNYQVYHRGNVNNVLQRDTQTYYRANNWIEFYNNTAGLYWNGGAANNWHLSPTGSTYMRVRSGNTSGCGLDMYTSNATRGYVYANSSNHIGFLNSSGSWVFRSDPSGNTTTVFSQHLQSNTDSSYDLGTNSTRWRNVYADNLYGDGSNITNLPAGGAAFTATADGALAANKAVYVQDNGTVKQVATVQNPRDWNSGPQGRHTNVYIGGGDNDYSAMCFDAAHNKIVMVGKGIHGAQSSAYWGVNVKSLGTGGSDGFVLGTTANTSFDVTNGGFEYVPSLAYSPDNELSAVFYGGAYAGRVRLIECTTTDATSSSSNSFNLGSAHTFESTNDRAHFIKAIYHPGVNKFVVAWGDDDNNKGYIQTCTVTGTTSSASVSFGTKVEFNSSETKYIDMAYDPNADRIYLTYWRSGNNLGLRYVTVSGTSVSVASEQLVTNQLDNGGACAYDPDNNKLIVLWWQSSTNKAVAGTPGSSSVSFSSTVKSCQSGGTNGYKNKIIWEPASGYFYNTMLDNTRIYAQQMRLTSGDSGRTIETQGSRWYSNSGLSTWSWCTPPNGHDHTIDAYVIFGHKQNANTYMSTVRTTSTTSNLPGPNYFVGFPKQAYSNGQTATIQTFGSVVEGFSGLKPGWPYYVQPGGGVADEYSSQYWPMGDGYTWDDSSNSSHANLWNSWNPNASQNTTYITWENAPLAGLAVGTNKILLTTGLPGRGGAMGNWQDRNHTHA